MTGEGVATAIPDRANVYAGFVTHAATACAETPSALNANPERFDGRSVIVRGFLNLAPEAHSLFESRELNEEYRRRWHSDKDFDPKVYDKYCLTVANPGILFDKRRAFAGKTLVLKGKFIAKYLDGTFVDFGSCALPTAILIDVTDLKNRYPSVFRAD
jgi:hypothetical protein